MSTKTTMKIINENVSKQIEYSKGHRHIHILTCTFTSFGRIETEQTVTVCRHIILTKKDIGYQKDIVHIEVHSRTAFGTAL